MPVGAEAELALSRFVETMCGNPQIQDDLNDVDDLEKLRIVVQSIESSLTGAALIPLEQATRPPKILVDSGVAAATPESTRIFGGLVACSRGINAAPVSEDSID